MKIFDIMLKDELVRTSTDTPKATLNAMALSHQDRINYVLKVLNAPIDIQIAVRSAAQVLNQYMFPNQLVDLLDIWLSPIFRLVTTSVGAEVNLPQSEILVEADALLFPPSGSLRLNTSNGPQLVNYTGIEESQFFSSLAQFTGCSGGSGHADQSEVVTFVTFEFDISDSALQARKDLFIAAFTRRSQSAIGALNFINDLHVWEGQQP